MKKTLVRGIGLVIGASAVQVLYKFAERLWWAITGEIALFPEDRPWWESGATIAIFLLAISKLVAAYGLCRLCSWARLFAVVVLSCDLLLRVAGTINLITFRYRNPETWATLKNLAESLPKESAQTISMWPSYITVGVSFLFAVVLTRDPVKRCFKV